MYKVLWTGLGLIAAVAALVVTPQTTYAQPAFAGIFGSRELTIENPNAPGTNYTMMLHDANDPSVYDELEYDSGRGYGFVVLDPDDDSDDRFGPFDDSPNGRGNFDPDDDLYNSFIGFKNFAQECSADVVGERGIPCAPEIDPEGGIFRVDVPNGSYRFVSVMGDSDHPHAHRLVAENGGAATPGELTNNAVTLIGNHDQADWFHGTGDIGRFGSGVFARVGFDDKLPPAPTGDSEGSLPAFVDYGEDGNPLTECTSPLDPMDEEELLWKETPVLRHDGEEYSVLDVTCTSPGPSSPTLEVTEGYIQFHILQANSNNNELSEEGIPYFTPEDVEVNLNRDPNGGDMVLLEVWPVSASVPGDFDGDGLLTAVDMDILTAGVKEGTDPQYDLNSDGAIDQGDRGYWIKDLKMTWVGDADLNGEFNSADFVAVFTAGLYETGQMAGWAQGDWDGDMFFNSGDFVAAFTDGGYELGPLPATAAVPEPGSLILLAIGGLALIRRRR